MSTTERWIITGRVQGVGYREWLVDAARQASVRGHVRNRDDGTVEAIVSAADARLEDLAALARVGPRSAIVSSLDRSPIAERELPPEFERR